MTPFLPTPSHSFSALETGSHPCCPPEPLLLTFFFFFFLPSTHKWFPHCSWNQGPCSAQPPGTLLSAPAEGAGPRTWRLLWLLVQEYPENLVGRINPIFLFPVCVFMALLGHLPLKGWLCVTGPITSIAPGKRKHSLQF